MQASLARRRLSLLALFATSILGAAACSRAPDDRDALVVALGTPPATYDPRLVTDAVGQRLSALLFAALVHQGPALEIVPEAATEWRYDAAAKTWHFRLRPGLRFSDGGAVRAEDIDWSFAQFLSPKSPFNGSFKAIASARATYDVVGGGALELKLREPAAWLLVNLQTIKIMRKDDAPFGGASGLDFVGSGAYRLKSATDARIDLSARDDCPYVSPRMPRLAFKIVRDDETRVLKAIKGEIDVAQNEISISKAKLLENRPGLRVIKYPGLSTTYLLINFQDPTLARLEARRAISLAIDRKAIAERKLQGLASPAAGILSPSHPWANHALAAPARDLEKARALWAKATASLAAPPTLAFTSANNPSTVENAKVIAAQLREAGIAVEQRSLDWGAFYDDVKKGRFQIALLKWVGVTDPDLHRLAFHSAEAPPSGRNRGRYANSALDPLLVAGPREIDERKRREIYDRIQKIALDDLPIVPLWHESEIAAVRDVVSGYVPPLDGGFASLPAAVKKELAP